MSQSFMTVQVAHALPRGDNGDKLPSQAMTRHADPWMGKVGVGGLLAAGVAGVFIGHRILRHILRLRRMYEVHSGAL